MVVDPLIAADFQGSGIDVGDPGGLCRLHEQLEAGEGKENPWHQLHKPGVGDQVRKVLCQVDLYVIAVKMLEIAVSLGMKKDHNGHDLTGGHSAWSPPFFTIGEEIFFDFRLKF